MLLTELGKDLSFKCHSEIPLFVSVYKFDSVAKVNICIIFESLIEMKAQSPKKSLFSQLIPKED